MATPGNYAKEVRSLGISGDGATAISGGDDDAVCIWAVPSGKALGAYRFGVAGYDAVAISPDAKLGVEVSTIDHKLRLFKIEDGTVLATLPCAGRDSKSIQFTPGSRRLVYADRFVLRVWDIPSRSEVAAFAGSRTEILSVSISPDGRSVATGSGMQYGNGWPIDTVVRVWRLPRS